MKQWNKPELMELKISETSYHWIGNKCDGGYIGDGIISGHLTWCDKTPSPDPTPDPNPTTKLS